MKGVILRMVSGNTLPFYRSTPVGESHSHSDYLKQDIHLDNSHTHWVIHSLPHWASLPPTLFGLRGGRPECVRSFPTTENTMFTYVYLGLKLVCPTFLSLY